jgi:damage-control phosphatase, subfamily I
MTARMQTQLDCLPCFMRQALEAARQVTDDEEVQRAVMHRVCHALQLVDVRRSPPAMAQQIHRIIRAVVGDDPFRKLKVRMNRLGVRLREQLRSRVEQSPDPFEAGVRVAIAANCIDFGARSDVTPRRVTREIMAAFEIPLHGSAEALRLAANRARSILYLADNAGEIALDGLLIEQLPRGAVTVAVRGRPVINDATLEDAQAVGLPDWVNLIDNGSDAPGTLLSDCARPFRNAFAQADLIISKGQGNYESLAGTHARPIHFLLVPKCPLVAQHLGAPEGVLVVHTVSSSRRRSVGPSEAMHTPESLSRVNSQKIAPAGAARRGRLVRLERATPGIFRA